MRPLVVLLVLSFAVSQLLALFVGAQLLQAGISVTENPSDVGNAYFYFAYIVVSAVALLIVLKFYKGKFLFYAFELFLAFISVQLLASIFFDDAVSLILAVAAVAARIFKPDLRTPLIIISAGVVGALLGASFTLLPAFILALLLAGYDAVAVFGTKHMVTMAKELDSRDAAFALTFGKRDASERNAAKPAYDFAPKAFKAKPHAQPVSVSKMQSSSNATPKRDLGSFVQLGTGDLVVPALLSVSALREDIALAVAIAFGSFVGLLVLFQFLERKRGYWPALPFLIGFAAVAAGAYYLLP